MKNILFVVITIFLAVLFNFFLGSLPIWLGAVAAWITTGSFLLQVFHILKQKDTKGLSLGMWCALLLGVSCWSGYGIKVGDMPVLIANSVTACLALTVIFLKLWNERPTAINRQIQLRPVNNIILKPRIRKLHLMHGHKVRKIKNNPQT